MILLINPKTSKKSEPNTRFFREPNIGLLYLAAILDEKDYSVEILDLEQYMYENEYQKEKVLHQMVSHYEIFGITSLTNNFSDALEIAKFIKKFNPSKKVVFGGAHVSFQFSKILQDPFKREYIDYICVGEAEKSFPQLVKTLNTSINLGLPKETIESKLESIPGLAFLDSNQSLIFTGFPEKAIDVESIPSPARYKLAQENFVYRVANVIVNRGCPNRCSFCSRQNLFKKTRIRSVESIISEIRDILSYKSYSHINFYDNINIRKSFLQSLCDELINQFIENNVSLSWGGELRADTISLKDAKLLKKAGCRIVATGIESANKRVLETNFKFQDPNKVREGIINLKKEKIPIQTYFVLGLPGETEESFSETIEFIKNLPLTEHDTINYFAATPYPGSKLWEERDNLNLNIIEKDFRKYDCEHIIFETEELKKNQLEKMFQRAKQIENYFKKN